MITLSLGVILLFGVTGAASATPHEAHSVNSARDQPCRNFEPSVIAILLDSAHHASSLPLVDFS
jgi:hypothetical protein